MHWFDRLSRQVAESSAGATDEVASAVATAEDGSDAGSTRRTVLKGATLAAFTLPFAPQLAGHAAAAGVAGTATREHGVVQMPPGYEQLESTSEFCNNCMTRSYGKHDYKWKACGASSNPKPFLKPKGGGGGKKATKKATPSKAAKQLACQAKVLKSLDKELQQCRMHFCEGDSEPPTPPTPGVEANPNPTCPSGTSICSREMCCYGGDACCVCASTGGFICCAGVIGCTCC
jgi:hypothetical protein